MTHTEVHNRCPWCGVCLICQKQAARDSKCGNQQVECERAKLHRSVQESMRARDADPDS